MAITPQTPPTTYTEGNCSGYTAVSEIFTFNVDIFCNRQGIDQLQLMFRNRYGSYDYFTFQAGKSEGLNIERQTYKQWNVDWGSDNPTKEQYSRGLTDFSTQMVETHVINSGFLNYPDFVYLEELYTSDDVYEIRQDGQLRAINIINTDFIRKVKGDRNIVNIELTYVYSNNIGLLSK